MVLAYIQFFVSLTLGLIHINGDVITYWKLGWKHIYYKPQNH